MHAEQIFKMQTSLYFALEWDVEKGKLEKEGKNKSQHLCFLSNDKHGAQKSVTKFFIGEKEQDKCLKALWMGFPTDE